MEDMGQKFARFTQITKGVVALSTAATLHLFRVGVIVLAQQAPPQGLYQESPLDRIERHLESNDRRLDDMQKTVSTLEGGAEVSLSIIGVLSILGFIKPPALTRRSENKDTHVPG